MRMYPVPYWQVIMMDGFDSEDYYNFKNHICYMNKYQTKPTHPSTNQVKNYMPPMQINLPYPSQHPYTRFPTFLPSFPFLSTLGTPVTTNKTPTLNTTYTHKTP